MHRRFTGGVVGVGLNSSSYATAKCQPLCCQSPTLDQRYWTVRFNVKCWLSEANAAVAEQGCLCKSMAERFCRLYGIALRKISEILCIWPSSRHFSLSLISLSYSSGPIDKFEPPMGFMASPLFIPLSAETFCPSVAVGQLRSVTITWLETDEGLAAAIVQLMPVTPNATTTTTKCQQVTILLRHISCSLLLHDDAMLTRPPRPTTRCSSRRVPRPAVRAIPHETGSPTEHSCSVEIS